MQNELQEFLGQYVPKVASLQAMLSSNVANGVPYDNRSVSQPIISVLHLIPLLFKSPLE